MTTATTRTLTRAHQLQAEHDTAPISSTLGMAITVVSLALLLWQVIWGSGSLLMIFIQVGIIGLLIALVNLAIALVNRPALRRVRTLLPEGAEVEVTESADELVLSTPGGELRYDLSSTRGRPLKATLRMEPQNGPRLAIPRGLLSRAFLRRFDA